MSKFAALRQARKDGDWWKKFMSMDKPTCPHCGAEYDISENGTYRLYEEGEHEVTCGSCDEEFTVQTAVSFSFSTDSQDVNDDTEDGGAVDAATSDTEGGSHD